MIYQDNYNAVISMLKKNFRTDKKTGLIKGPIKGAEIGVRHGIFTEALYKACENLHMTCVDPYLPYHDIHHIYTAEEQHEIFKAAWDRVTKLEATFLIMTSEEGSNNVADNSLDFVFIDAGHTYQDVHDDLRHWFRKVKPGGFMSGHDYSMAGVQQAVKQFWTSHAEQLGDQFVHYDNPADVWAFEVIKG